VNVPFRSPGAFHDGFVKGLQRQLEAESLGALILVLANATFDPAVWGRMHPEIAKRFAQKAREVRERLRAGEAVPGSEDDLFVFLKLMAAGFDGLGSTEFRRADAWELQYNPVRGLRPQRVAGKSVDAIEAPFDPDRFHFDLPHLKPEVFWEGQLAGLHLRCLYNKFPFAPCHLLLVPEPSAQRPQRLEKDILDWLWRVADTVGAALPGFGVGYNSYGAFASVNHLHFQAFLRDPPLPLEDPRWRHNGGAETYPVTCHVARDPQAAWQLIDQCHLAGTAHNLILRPGVMYVLPRRLQGSYASADWVGGHAWYEMAGGAVVPRRSMFDTLDGTQIAGALAATAL
jgi:hypothetical protein